MHNKEQLLSLYDREERQRAVFYNSQREVTPYVVRFRPLPGMKGGSYILYSRLDENNADEVIRQEIAHFERLGCSCEWKLYDHDQPADLRERLAAHGFVIEEAEALMVLDLAVTPESLKQPILHDVRRITDPALIPTILNVQQTVWAEKDILYVQEAIQELRLNGQHISYYAAYADGNPVCSAWIRFSETGSFASLWGGATLPEYRRRGFYTALLAARTQEAIRRGYHFLTIDASPKSRPIVERNGFQFLVHTHPCKWIGRTAAQ